MNKKTKLVFKNDKLVGSNCGFEIDKQGYKGVWRTNDNGDKYFIRVGESIKEAQERYKNEKAQKYNSLVNKYDNLESQNKTNRNIKKSKLPISKEEFFGIEFKGYKKQDAINKLLKEKKGHVKNAFYRKELGYIDVIWGNDDAGLCHIIKQRDKKFYDGIGHILGIDMVNKIVTIVENGEILDTDNKLRIEYDGYRVGISPKYHNEKINWIVTAMEIL